MPTAFYAKVVVKDLVEEFLRRLEAALDKAKEMGGDSTFQDPETEF